ncbi:MAG: sulfotransferase [Firmicutes bacterium]|nr:sulfotransferase [Bacillota bacterium]
MLPNFLVVGAAKSGTSSIDRYLGQHPDVYMPPKKEAHYFSKASFPDRFTGPGDDGMNMETIGSLDRYESLFDDVCDQKAIGESSAFYLYYPETAERIAAVNPEMKIVIVLRNPVERAFSAYMYLMRDERETLSFEAGLAAEEERRRQNFEPMWLYRELGLYAEQVRRYLDVFGPNQVKVILYDEFARDNAGIMADLFSFLGVRTDFPIDTSIRYNESGKPKSRALFNFVAKPNLLKEMVKPFVPLAVRERLGNRAKSMILERVDMDFSTRAELKAFYSQDIRSLQTLLGRDLSRWL